MEGCNLKSRIISILISMFLLIFVSNVLAQSNIFDFYGYVKDANGNYVSGANVTLREELMGPGGTPLIFSTLSDANGFFNISSVNGSTLYLLSIVKYSNGVAQLVNKPLPPLPSDMYEFQLINQTFYLKDAATINITMYNESGDDVSFNGFVLDTKYNYPIAKFEDENNPVIRKEVVIPAGRFNYSVVVWKSGYAPPRSFNAIAYNTSRGDIVNVRENITTNMFYLTGYLKWPNGSNVTNVNFTDVASYFPISNFLPLDGEIKGFQKYVGSKGGYAWYNISVPGPNLDIFVMAFANDSEYYMGTARVTITGNKEENITIYPLAGSYDIATSTSVVNVNTSKTTINVFYDNGTQNVSAGETFFDILVNYNGTQIKFTAKTNLSGSAKIPLRNDTGATIEIFNDRFPPRKFTYSGAELESDINIILKGFDRMEDVEGNIIQDIKSEFFVSNSSCDVPNPPSDCLVFEISNASNPREGVKLLLLPGDVSVRLTQLSTNIVVHYKNTDLIASGPPDFEPSTRANNTGSGASLRDIWRFGSLGPEIYESLLVGVPYNSSRIDETYAPLPSILIGNLYDVQNNWVPIWNSTDDPNASNVPSAYSDFDSRWFNASYGGMPCTNDLDVFNSLSQGCYVDKTNDMIWLKIPHFSGLGITVQAYANLGNITSDRASYSCYPSCSAYINLTMNNSDLAGVQNISVNNTATVTGITYKIEYKNLSNGEWVYLGTANDNNSWIYDYDLVLYNSSNVDNTTHQFRINITLPSALSTKWNFSLVINGSIYTLDPWLDSINLTSPADGASVASGSNNFVFTLFSDSYPTQNCTLYVDGSAVASNASTVNGSATTLTASVTSSGSWYVSCNETGNSEVRTFIVDTTGPSITSLNYPGNNLKVGSSSINFNWTATDDIDTSFECNLTLDGLVNASSITVSNGTPANYTVNNINDGTHNWSVICEDGVGNTGSSQTYTFYIDTTAPTVTMNQPTDGMNTSSRIINVTIVDSIAGIDNESIMVDTYIWNGSAFINQTRYLFPNNVSCTSTAMNSTSTTCTFNASKLPDTANSSINISVFVNDSLDNQKVSSIVFNLDTVVPVMNSISLSDSYISSGQAITVTVNSTDTPGTGISSVTLTYSVDSVNDTTLTKGTGDLWLDSILVTESSDGSYNISATSVDYAGNSNAISAIIRIDNTAPTISGAYADNSLLSNSPTITDADGNVTINWTITDVNLSSTNLSIDSGVITNSSTSAVNSFTTSLSAGEHNATISAIDEAGNSVTTTYTFYMNSQENTSEILSKIQNAIGSDTALSLSLKESDGTDLSSNLTYLNKTLVLEILLNGTNGQKAWGTIREFSGLYAKWNNSDKIRIEKDSSSSIGTRITQRAGTTLDKFILFRNASYFLGSSRFSQGASIIFNQSLPSGYDVLYIEDDDGETIYKLSRCTTVPTTITTDNMCYVNTSNNVTLYIPHFSGGGLANDTTAPIINITDPVNNTIKNNSYFTLTFDVWEANPKTNNQFCRYNLTNSTNKEIEVGYLTTPTPTGTKYTFTKAISGLKNDTYNITIICADLNNQSRTVVHNFTVADSIAPRITSISTSSSGTTEVTVTLSVTTDEAATCRYSSADVAYSSMSLMSSTGGTSHSYSNKFYLDSSGRYYVRCMDEMGNAMTSSNSTSYSIYITEETTTSSGGGGGGIGYRLVKKKTTAFELIDIIREFYEGTSKLSAFDIIDKIREFYGG